MHHFPRVLGREESNKTADHVEAHFLQYGFGPWAVEVRGGASFIGCVGLMQVDFLAPFTPAVEILWRLDRSAWGRGYATEAAVEALRIAFSELGLSEIVAFTVPANARSRAVMARLGMTHDSPGDFDHPKLAPGDPLRRHVLYRLGKQEWMNRLTR